MSHLNNYLLKIGRRFLGSYGTKIVRNLVGDLTVALGFVEAFSNTCRDDCISALMRVKDEEWWIESSILSIKDLVYEYVIVDQSLRDNTPQIIERIKEDFGLNIKHIIDHNPDYVAISNKGLGMTTCRWILRWDGDYVARDELVPTVRKLIESLDKRKYYNIYWPHINFEVDVFHINIVNPLHIEHWLVSYSPKVRFIDLGDYEFLYTPLYNKRIEIEKPLSLHLRTVKPPLRLLEWRYWWEMRKKRLLGKIELYSYIRMRIREDFGTDDINVAAAKFIEVLRMRKDLGKYNKEIWGDYPRIFKEYVLRKFNIAL